MERVMDHVADRLGADRVDLRLRHLIGPDEFPYRRPSGAVLDSGDYPRALRRVVERAGAASLPAMRSSARARGRRLGLGIAMELTPEGVAVHGSLMNNGYDGATVRISPTGEVTVLAGVTSPGTGNETALAQIAADALGCAVELAAADLRAKLVAVAASMLGAAADEVVGEHERFSARSRPGRAVGWL